MTQKRTLPILMSDEALAKRLAVLRAEDNVADWAEIDALAAEQLRREEAEAEAAE